MPFNLRLREGGEQVHYPQKKTIHVRRWGQRSLLGWKNFKKGSDPGMSSPYVSPAVGKNVIWKGSLCLPYPGEWWFIKECHPQGTGIFTCFWNVHVCQNLRQLHILIHAFPLYIVSHWAGIRTLLKEVTPRLCHSICSNLFFFPWLLNTVTI